MMFAAPAVTVVTRPVAETVATDALSEDQVIERPLSMLPLASRVTAEACVVCPATNELAASDTATDATGIGVTVIVAVAILVSLTAAIVACPGATPDTR